MTRIGLHLGLNGVNPSSYNGWPGTLNACCADAADLAALFARAGYDTRALLNEDATLDRLVKELNSAAATLVAGDWLTLTFSGHGGRAGAWTLSGYRETICLYDGQFSDSMLHGMLEQFREGVNVAVLLDACHSGGMDRAFGFGAASKAAPAWIESKVLTPAYKAPEPKCNALFMTACTAAETAQDGQYNGAFTGSALACCTGHAQTWAQWYGAMASYMLKAFPSQHPQLLTLGPKIATDRPVFA